ncbi:MAG: phosphoribosylglycinamide synthetase C domain-containing protein [bacterium]|nr:phosphoribosylglycinamide synthetase C domain-containing protein [bacterium]
MEKKNFLFVSIDGLTSDLAWQIYKEGHDVKYYISNKDETDIADGFIPKTDDWRKQTNWADIIIFDDVLGQGKKAEKLRAEGKKVIGGTAYTDMLEDDRGFGQEELKNHGVNILTYKLFTDFKEAIDYVKKNPAKYVIKPSGEAQNIKRLLFVGMEEDGNDVVRVLEAYSRVWSKIMKEFALQKKVNGVEVAVGAFFNGNKFIYPININFENKKLFPGNLGPATGEMGTSMFWCGNNRIFNNTLKKFEKKLEEEKFHGYIDINCIVNNNGVHPLEFTTRFGYPTISIQQEGMLTPIGQFLFELASGKPDIELKVKNGYQVGVRVVVPPYPFRDRKTFDTYSKGATIVFKKKNLEGIHIEDVKLENNQWVVTGSSGVALIVGGCGNTMKLAQQQAYSRIKNILIPNMYYRTDIGDRWYEDFDKLHTWGYLQEI